jgi:hypothetical protein
MYLLPDKLAESVGGTLLDVLNNVGMPKAMVAGLVSEMVGRNTPFRKELTKRGVPMKNAENGRHGSEYSCRIGDGSSQASLKGSHDSQEGPSVTVGLRACLDLRDFVSSGKR